ncbi:hypothetical protein E4T66_18435 [Sinimarinibacterium sp. CAU 1509]|uniref:hypothetical protein n=1 Tax=Sinimarinibacterium sp. CAU 1509 TaxID=2562283 RepID=UPI0010AD020C|nr:hypothetical protein [Sinimarinibacterium sp. CAU 1509]TJY57385.1 hypothetical protein E4T66_18435 [Sinimarinibacterium sp. CAU 1509]
MTKAEAAARTAFDPASEQVARCMVEVDLALDRTRRSVRRALGALLWSPVEIELFRRLSAPNGRLVVYVNGRPESSFEPEFVLDPQGRSRGETAPIIAAFGGGVGGESRLREFYRLARTYEAIGGLVVGGSPCRLFPQVFVTRECGALEAA